MKRDFSLIEDSYDAIIIGGGATGLGLALEAASRGFKTLLLEANDFAKGTSSRSTKLLHGGVRYLAQGDLRLVYEALHERSRVIANAPHLCKAQAFIIPAKNIFEAIYYYIGLSIYDVMAGKMSLGRTKFLGKKQAKEQLANIKDEQMNYGVMYYDGQFDDARCALSLAYSAKDAGACVMNYAKVVRLYKENGKICGVCVQDMQSSERKNVRAKCVFNATGVFTNEINKMDDDETNDIVPSQGIHLVFDKKFCEGQNALMVPKTSDGRVLFAIPWHDELVVGTTDTLVENIDYEPKALESEIEFILETARDYFATPPKKEDIKSVFVGLRPLAKPSKHTETKKVSRSHKVSISKSNLISINGGKWTTYRAMADDGMKLAMQNGLLQNRGCVSKDYKLHGYTNEALDERLRVYGSDAKYIKELEKDPKFAAKISEKYPYTYAQIKWAIESEMALSLEDLLARRIRLLLLDAREAAKVAPDVARFCEEELGSSRAALKVDEFIALCEQHLA